MRKLLATTIAAITILSGSMVSFAAEDDVTVKIFHTNDIHSRALESFDEDVLENIGYARFKTFIDSEAADGKIVVDVGDAFHGQAIATLERGASIARMMSAVGYDYMVPGNHDFNYGQVRQQSLKYTADVHYLGTNIDKDGTGVYPYARYAIDEIEGVRIGFVGLITPETAYKTNPKNVAGLNFYNNEETYEVTQEMVDMLMEDGCDVIVALSHLGTDEYSELKATDVAMNVDGIDVIIDGHSHSLHEDDYMVNDTYITSAGEYFENVGVVTITKEADGDVMIDPEIYPASELSDLEEDEDVKELVMSIQEDQKSILEQVVADTSIALDGERESVRYGHTNLGNLITSAMLNETGADVAITNGGGIRASIAEGAITKSDILTVLPFGNYVMTKELTGAQIIEALEHGMVVGAGSFPQFAGMTVTANTVSSTNSDGTVVETGDVISVMINGQALVPTQTYTVATNDFMAVGGDGYEIFTGATHLNDFAGMDEVFIDYMANTADDVVEADAEEVRLTLR